MSTTLDRQVSTGATCYPRQVFGSFEPPTPLDPGSITPRGTTNSVSIRITAPGLSPSHRWLASRLEADINGMLQLPYGWDGENASRITMDAVKATVSLVWQVYDEPALAPLLFPLPGGGIQAEWHAARQSVEIEVDEEGSAHLFITDEQGAVVVNRELSAEDSDVLNEAKRAVSHLSARILSAR